MRNFTGNAGLRGLGYAWFLSMMRKQKISQSLVISEPVVSVDEASGKEALNCWWLWLMVWLSGFSCLIYQILWMRELGLLFGNSAQAGAMTLAVFFAGLAIGSWWWGQKSSAVRRPLRACAGLEFGIAACGVATLLAPQFAEAYYPTIYQQYGKGMLLQLFMLMCSWVMVFPAAFFMGGTMPMIGQAMIRDGAGLGKQAARMYALNTLGAAVGAFAAAFVLIGALGMRATCGIAMGISVIAGLIAWRISSRENDAIEKRQIVPTKVKNQSKAEFLSRWQIRAMAFFSGFSVLGLEVIWTRLMAQVHENSVYGFSAILVLVLVCLALGSWLASFLARKEYNPALVVSILFTVGGLSLCAIPYAFHSLTNGGAMLPTDSSFVGYVIQLFVVGLLALGPAALSLGTIFPYLMKAEQQHATEVGRSIGHISAVNTVGAVLGSLAAGFVLLEWLGPWRSMQVMASGYFLVALFLPLVSLLGSAACKVVSVVSMGFAFVIFSPKKWSHVAKVAAAEKKEVVLETWHASDCTVSVVKNAQNDVAIKINENYGLGSRLAFTSQIFQTRIPMLIFPQTERIFYLGMGTGITAGEALDRQSYPRVSKVMACEISASVIAASRKYFGGGDGSDDLTNGLYKDPRAKVIHEDGRNHLMATAENYQMINADLFLPYRRGTGNLYSKEHFANAKKRLSQGGVFVQWLPLYQVSENEFGTIARTMLEVFPQVTLWRGNFIPGAETAAIIGHADSSPIPPCLLDTLADQRKAVAGATHREMNQLMLPTNEQTILFFYCGNLTKARDFFEKYPVNTYDHPVIEFATPRSLHQAKGQKKPQFLEDRFAGLVDRLLERTPPVADPVLTLRSSANRKLPMAGAAFHQAAIASVHGKEEDAARYWQSFLDGWQDDPFAGQGDQ